MSLIRHAQPSLSYRRSLMLNRHHATSCLIWSGMVACILTERHPATYFVRVQLGHLEDVAGLAQLSWKPWVLQSQLWLPELQLWAVIVHLQDLCLRPPWQALFLHSNSAAGQMHVTNSGRRIPDGDVFKSCKMSGGGHDCLLLLCLGCSSDVVHLDDHTHQFLHSPPKR